MNGARIPPLPIDVRQLHTRRCVRHASREAAARCPGCGEFFCRECIVEHEGKLLCAACLARATAARERRQPRLAAVRRAGSAGVGARVLWRVFYWVLLKIPPDFHDGTIWKKATE